MEFHILLPFYDQAPVTQIALGKQMCVSTNIQLLKIGRGITHFYLLCVLNYSLSCLNCYSSSFWCFNNTLH